MRWALLHSPLTGPIVWQAVASAASKADITAKVLGLPDLCEATPPYYPGLAAAVAGQIEPDTALIVHSGAGGLARAVVEACPGRIDHVVFVDAILPYPGRTWFETANSEFGEGLRARATDGLVPSWDQWFPPETLAGLIGDHALRKRFVRELRPTPLAFLDEAAPDLAWPEAVSWSYLRLSKAYEAEAQSARHEGRATLRLEQNHLGMMSEPAVVVAALRNLIRG